MNIDTITYLFLGVIVFILLIIVLVKGCSNSENYTDSIPPDNYYCSQLPVGAIIPVLPGNKDIIDKAIRGDGFMLCNGQWVNSEFYEDLAGFLGLGTSSRYYDKNNPDANDDVTSIDDIYKNSFKLPNFNGKFLIGTVFTENGNETDKETMYGGYDKIQSEHLPAHSHGYAGIFDATAKAEDSSGGGRAVPTFERNLYTDKDIYPATSACNVPELTDPDNYNKSCGDCGKDSGQCGNCCFNNGCQYLDEDGNPTQNTTKIESQTDYEPANVKVIYVMYVGFETQTSPYYPSA